MDYSAIDNLLKQIEPLFANLLSLSPLQNGSIESWRWDAPDTTLTWSSPDRHNGKSIDVGILTDDLDQPQVVTVHICAWEDDLSNQIRYWEYRHIGSLSVTDFSDSVLKDILDKAHEILVNFTPQDLTHHSSLR